MRRKKILYVVMLILLVPVIILPAAKAIQTQESDKWDGIEVDLTKISIKNNVMTVKFKLRNAGDEEHKDMRIDFSKCYFMDEANQKKYYVLKDSDGTCIAGPLWSGNIFRVAIKPGKSRSLWLKFPEPTDNPETIVLNIPGVPLFEEVNIKK
ncbi:MAG: hypothetical protein GY940_40960 [bacterium]|nr:hypothetical protein [bacterium]